MKWTVVIVAMGFAPAWGQSALSLADAVRMGLEHHPAVEASVANKQAAQSRIEQARAGFLPKVAYSEAYQRSNNPIFVFGSLLTQHRFAQQNFDLGTLNTPNFLNNFQSQLSVDQVLFDAGEAKAQVASAEAGSQIAAEAERRARMDVIAGVAGAYYGAVLAKERLWVAQEALRSGEADLRRAETVRGAGMSTDADVLSVRVHLAGMKEREIQARYALEVASAALNDALGEPLETQRDLSTPLVAARLPNATLESLDRTSVQERPDTRGAVLSVRAAESQSAGARSSLFPRISLRGVFEADRRNFVTRGGANWFVGASLEWNLFNGFSDQSRRREAEQLVTAARAQQKQTESAVRLEVRRANADWKGADERIEVATTAVAEAEESLRITRNRYEAGLTTVTELLRNETAWLETQTRHLEAIYQQRLAATALELAAGTLTGDSDALK